MRRLHKKAHCDRQDSLQHTVAGTEAVSDDGGVKANGVFVRQPGQYDAVPRENVDKTKHLLATTDGSQYHRDI
jgi:hypothetical protein